MSLSHLISIRDLTREEAILILDTAEQMAATQRHGVKKLPTLQGKTVVNLFFEDSTRTRISFETAAKRLSSDVINFQSRGSSVSKGESLKDTALTLEAMGADAVIVRHSSSGAAHRLAHAGWMNLPVLNAGDGTHQHPTQALLDAMTLRRHYAPSLGDDGTPAPGSGLDGAHVVIVGDVLHSRVARSNVDLLTLLGARVPLVAPRILPRTHDTAAVLLLRIFLSAFLGGGFAPLLYSMAGGLASFAAMALLLRRTQLSLVGISAVGGLLHNMAQLLVAAAVMESSALLLYAPLLGVVGILTGTGIGILAQSIVKKINTR